MIEHKTASARAMKGHSHFDHLGFVRRSLIMKRRSIDCSATGRDARSNSYTVCEKSVVVVVSLEGKDEDDM